MTSEDALIAVLNAIEHANIPYMLAGSFSSNLYGIPRSTRDADFVVQTDARAVFDVIRTLGPAFRIEPQIAFETVTATTKIVAWVDEVPFKFEFFLLSDDAHDRERFARRVRVKFFGGRTRVPTPEDVVITKLRWSRLGRRSKDVEDVRNVIAVQNARLDWAYVEDWCARHGTRQLLEQIRAECPPPLSPKSED